MSNKEFKVNDRVKRASGAGSYGTVKDIREETTMVPTENRHKALMINVLWDSGTLSYFAPDALEKVKEN